MSGRRLQEEATKREPGPRLPPWKAFVVQFTADSKATSGILAGRIEHLASGTRARFGSGAELLECLQRLLDEAGD